MVVAVAPFASSRQLSSSLSFLSTQRQLLPSLDGDVSSTASPVNDFLPNADQSDDHGNDVLADVVTIESPHSSSSTVTVVVAAGTTVIIVFFSLR